MEIELGRECDVDNWMQLVNKVKDSFPGLETKEALEEHRHTVLGFMRKGSAICARVNDQIVGALLFSREDSMLCFLAVDENYRRQRIAEKMVTCMLSLMNEKGMLSLRPTGKECRRELQPEPFTNDWDLLRES